MQVLFFIFSYDRSIIISLFVWSVFITCVGWLQFLVVLIPGSPDPSSVPDRYPIPCLQGGGQVPPPLPGGSRDRDQGEGSLIPMRFTCESVRDSVRIDKRIRMIRSVSRRETCVSRFIYESIRDSKGIDCY